MKNFIGARIVPAQRIIKTPKKLEKVKGVIKQIGISYDNY
jgi:hypothetical protein